MKFNPRDLLAIPNMLSVVRLILVPIFISMYINANSVQDYRMAGAVILFSGLTDLLDGFIARKWNQITDLGKLLDPVADKITQAAVVICLMLRFDYMWIIVIFFMLKELSMLMWNIILFRQDKRLDGALWYGKVSTAVFYACMIILVGFPSISTGLASTLMIITGFFLLLSFIMYTKKFLTMYQN